MSVRLYVYAGPVVLIDKSQNFDHWNFSELIGQALFEREDISNDYHVLFPNLNTLSEKSHTYSYYDGDGQPVLISPNIREICDWFTEQIKPYTDKLTVPWKVEWAVVPYWY